MKLPKGVIMIPLDDPALLHDILSEVFNEHPDPRRDLRKDNGTPPETPGGDSDDGPPTPRSGR